MQLLFFFHNRPIYRVQALNSDFTVQNAVRQAQTFIGEYVPNQWDLQAIRIPVFQDLEFADSGYVADYCW